MDINTPTSTIDFEIPSSPVFAQQDEPPVAAPVIDPMKFPDPPVSPHSNVRCTVENLTYLLNAYSIMVGFNVLKKRLDCAVPGLNPTTLNRDQVTLTHIENLAIKHRMQPGRVANNLLNIGDSAPFDPMADWIDSKPWDGKDRLRDFCDTVVPADGYSFGFRDVLIQKWGLSIVAATFPRHGFRSRGVLTFQGAQGIGKTSWFKRLISDGALRDQAIKLGHSWDGGSKDSKLSAVKHRIVELGELEGSFRNEISGLKAFLTEDYDKIRPPYARVEAEYPRQTIFCASVNQSHFLLDASGNSRFWTIAVERLDYMHDIDMQQVFAQLKIRYLAGDEWWLSRAEEQKLEQINRQHRSRNVVADRIEEALDLSLIEQSGLSRDSANEVLRKIGIERPTNTQSKEANAALRDLLGEPKKINGTYRWYVPWAKRGADNNAVYVNRPTGPEDEVY
jgi:predicted P-loop ATPase